MLYSDSPCHVAYVRTIPRRSTCKLTHFGQGHHMTLTWSNFQIDFLGSPVTYFDASLRQKKTTFLSVFFCLCWIRWIWDEHFLEKTVIFCLKSIGSLVIRFASNCSTPLLQLSTGFLCCLWLWPSCYRFWDIVDLWAKYPLLENLVLEMKTPRVKTVLKSK